MLMELLNENCLMKAIHPLRSRQQIPTMNSKTIAKMIKAKELRQRLKKISRFLSGTQINFCTTGIFMCSLLR